MTEAPHPSRGVDPAKPSPARLYDYYLGGHNNFEVDRKAAEALRESLPALSDAAWANRGFHQRAADDAGPWGLLERYVAALAPGSYLALSHATPDGLPPLAVHAMVATYANATEQLVLRPRAEVARFFAGMEMVPPCPGATDGLTFVGQWGAVDPASADSDGSRVLYCGVAKCR